MIFTKTDRMALMVDGQNTYAAVRMLGFDIDYKNLLAIFASKSRVTNAYYFNNEKVEEDGHCASRGLTDWLSYNGYKVILREVIEFEDNEGASRTKFPTFLVDMTLKVMKMIDTTDHFVFITGNGDLMPLIEELTDRGKIVTVVSTVRTKPAFCSDALRRAATHYIDLEALEASISKGARP